MRARFFFASAAILSFATPVFAHAFLQHADPGAGATLQAAHAPKRVALTFSEKLEPAFSGMAVTDRFGHDAAAAPVVIGGHSMVLPLRPLKPGNYRVAWHVVSVDTHHTEGMYRFTVKP
jgi:methionine-rich copper-binding protein CopC